MIAVLVDTDVLIEVFRKRDSAIVTHWLRLIESDVLLAYSPVTEAEIFHGIRHEERPDVVNVLEAITCLPIDSQIGRTAGEYMRLFHKSHSLHLPDALIAATASVRDLSFWTRNRKHFPMKDLRFFD